MKCENKAFLNSACLAILLNSLYFIVSIKQLKQLSTKIYSKTEK